MNHAYARLAVDTGADERIGLLAENSPLGLSLFLLSIGKAFPYGILPGSPREYRALVIPAGMIAAEDIQAAIDAQAEAGLVQKYDAGGRPAVYIRNYHRYQDVPWFRVKPSDLALPEDWVVPPSLQDVLDDGALARGNRHFGPFGVMGVSRSNTGTNHQVIPCRITDGFDGDQRGNLAVAVAVPVELDNDSRPLPLELSAQPATGEKLSYRDQVKKAVGHYSGSDLTLVQQFLDVLTTKKGAGGQTDQGRVSRLAELSELHERHGSEAWRHGLREGIRLDKPFTSYVRVIMENYQPAGPKSPRAAGPPKKDGDASLHEQQRRLDEEDELELVFRAQREKETVTNEPE